MEKILHHIEKYSPTGAKVTFTIPLSNHQETYNIAKEGKHWICKTEVNAIRTDDFGAVRVVDTVTTGYYRALTMMGVIRQIKDQMITTHNL